MPIIVRDLVEIIDEVSPLYHRIGVVVAFTRAGQPIVQFPRRHRTWRNWRGVQHRLAAEQVGLVPPSN